MIRWLIATLIALMAAPLAADELRPAVVELAEREEGVWALNWKLPIAASQGVPAPNFAQPVIPASCAMERQPVQRAGALALLGSAVLTCEGSLAGEMFGLTELLGNADAIARVVPLEGGVQTFRLTASSPTATIAAAPDRWQVARDYFVIGTEHILLGWDHLLFVIALVLLVRHGWSVVKAATAFTIAHSITLVATTLGYAGLPSRPVEALIALSIVFLAVELARMLRDPESETWTRRAPWLVAFAFGLLHGFGFAGALAEIGLPQGEVAAALVAFNLGVEAGQLLIIGIVLAGLALMRRLAPLAETPAIRTATYAIGIIGSFWMFERVLL
ncbi:MAG: HupE/UreJ family protein [Pseudomonadota bacterium]